MASVVERPDASKRRPGNSLTNLLHKLGTLRSMFLGWIAIEREALMVILRSIRRLTLEDGDSEVLRNMAKAIGEESIDPQSLGFRARIQTELRDAKAVAACLLLYSKGLWGQLATATFGRFLIAMLALVEPMVVGSVLDDIKILETRVRPAEPGLIEFDWSLFTSVSMKLFWFGFVVALVAHAILPGLVSFYDKRNVKWRLMKNLTANAHQYLLELATARGGLKNVANEPWQFIVLDARTFIPELLEVVSRESVTIFKAVMALGILYYLSMTIGMTLTFVLAFELAVVSFVYVRLKMPFGRMQHRQNLYRQFAEREFIIRLEQGVPTPEEVEAHRRETEEWATYCRRADAMEPIYNFWLRGCTFLLFKFLCIIAAVFFTAGGTLSAGDFYKIISYIAEANAGVLIILAILRPVVERREAVVRYHLLMEGKLCLPPEVAKRVRKRKEKNR